MRRYPSYKLSDFFSKTYLEGGLTYKQFMFLFESAEEERYQQDRFLASIHGIDLENADAESVDVTKPASSKAISKSPMMFGDPSEYEHLSEEEKKNLTKKMMGHYTPFVNNTMKGSKPKIHPS